MTMTDWAEREVEIAKKRERGDKPDSEWDYGCACYDSALKAYKSLMEDGHSSMSFSITRGILKRLMGNKPLTSIEDVPEVWNEIHSGVDGDSNYTEYQCKRKSSLFKKVYDDGHITYSDIDRAYGVSFDNPDITFSSGTITRYINEHYPITMPYTADDTYKMVTDDYDSVNNEPGIFDHEALLALYKNGEKVRDFEPIYLDLTGDEEKRITKTEYFEKRPKK